MKTKACKLETAFRHTEILFIKLVSKRNLSSDADGLSRRKSIQKSLTDGLQKTKSGERYLAIWLIVQTVKMTAATQAGFKSHARIIKALAHPTRLFILDELSRGERCVRDLTEMVGVEMATVSRHLSVLRNVGIIEDDKRGAQVFYRVRIPCVLQVFDCVKAIQVGARR